MIGRVLLQSHWRAEPSSNDETCDTRLKNRKFEWVFGTGGWRSKGTEQTAQSRTKDGSIPWTAKERG